MECAVACSKNKILPSKGEAFARPIRHDAARPFDHSGRGEENVRNRLLSAMVKAESG